MPKVNLFDLLVVILIMMACCISVISYSNRPFLGEKNVLVEVKISNTETIESILPMVVNSKAVYFSGTKYTVNQKSYRTESDANGKPQYLYITLEGLGKISDGDSIFNGQRIYSNQKVEIRSDYQVQGYITDFRYES